MKEEENSPYSHENWVLLHTAGYFAVQVFCILLLLLLKGIWYFTLQTSWRDPKWYKLCTKNSKLGNKNCYTRKQNKMLFRRYTLKELQSHAWKAAIVKRFQTQSISALSNHLNSCLYYDFFAMWKGKKSPLYSASWQITCPVKLHVRNPSNFQKVLFCRSRSHYLALGSGLIKL